MHNMNLLKKVLIMMPLTIPASGKSTVFNIIKQRVKKINVQILSSDVIRKQKMHLIMTKNPNISKQQAYLETKKQADAQYYHKLQHNLQNAYKSNQFTKTVVILDKNYSLITYQQALDEIREIYHRHKHQLAVKIVAVVPECKELLKLNQDIMLPFSSCYIASCIKRVLHREKHQTLQGTEIKRVNTCIGWANNFKNMNIKQKINQKQFDGVLYISFTKQQELPASIEQYIKSYLIQTPMNSFSSNQNPTLIKLIQQIKKWKYEEIQAIDSSKNIQQKLENIFVQVFDIKYDKNT